jgi:hypothetical protein
MVPEYPYVMLRNQHVQDGTHAPIDTSERDTNISIHGGCWDEGATTRGARFFHGDGNTFKGVQTCMLFNNLDHLTMTDVTFSHVASFCVQVGDFLVRYVSKFPDPTARVEELAQAEAYYNAVIERQTDLVGDAELGLANALSFSKDSAKQAKAAELYTKVSANPDPAVSGPALVGLTKLHLRTGDSASAIQTTTKYLRNKQNQRDRMDMMLMQGEAYVAANDTKNALLAYMNLFNQHKGKVLYSARACQAIMEIFWKRNNPVQGDRLQKGFQNSDRWTAWNTGYLYVQQIKKSGVEAKLTPEDRDEFNKVVSAVHNYGTDAAVMKEDKAHKELQRNINASKKKK